MARRDDLREVMRSLVAPEANDAVEALFLERRKNSVSTGAALSFSANQEQVLTGLRGQLNENGIAANETEIALALLERLAQRPALCRGLLAEYLMGEKSF